MNALLTNLPYFPTRTTANTEQTFTSSICALKDFLYSRLLRQKAYRQDYQSVPVKCRTIAFFEFLCLYTRAAQTWTEKFNFPNFFLNTYHLARRSFSGFVWERNKLFEPAPGVLWKIYRLRHLVAHALSLVLKVTKAEVSRNILRRLTAICRTYII